MSTITITPVKLDPDVATAALEGIGQTVTTSDTFEIIADGNTRTLIIVIEELNTGAATLVVNPGDNPPSFLAGLTAAGLNVAVAQDAVKILMLTAGEYIQADASTGKVTGSVLTNSLKLYALRISNAI